MGLKEEDEIRKAFLADKINFLFMKTFVCDRQKAKSIITSLCDDIASKEAKKLRQRNTLITILATKANENADYKSILEEYSADETSKISSIAKVILEAAAELKIGVAHHYKGMQQG